MRTLLKKYKLLSILLAVAATTLALMLLARLPALLGDGPDRFVVAEEDGAYNLSAFTEWDGGAVLPPGPVYYPGVLLAPGDADDAGVPRSEFSARRADYLSQRFAVRLSDTAESYVLTFKLSGRHAMRVYVNGVLAGQTGRVGTTKEDTEVWENNITVSASPVDGELDVILNSAQFYHARGGANLATLTVQKAAAAGTPQFTEATIGLLITGALLCAAALLLSVYLLLSHTKATLYFVLACLSMALRECLQSQAWTYFPINGNLSFMLEYLSVALLTVFLSLYLGQYASSKFLRVVQLLAIAGSAAYGGLTLLGDSLLYTGLLKYYQMWLVACIVTGVSGLFWNMRRPTGEQTAALYGIGVFYLAAVSDIAMYRNLLGEGRKAPITETAMLIFLAAQTVSLFLMNTCVLGEIREAERALTAEKTALENLDRMKTEFLGNVSHELKTPLTVMSGYAQTTRRLSEQLPAAQASEVSRRMTLISSEAERLSLMVGQILDVTRMEEGRMVMETAPCHLDEIVYAAVNTHYPILNKNQNRLEIQAEQGLPGIYADPARISQVIVNLISNAVRFTSEGSITISIRRVGCRILVRVSDTGCGVAPERLAHIFERYSKKEKSGGGQDTGTGLGLYICRHIVEQHGGRIWMESEVGVGTAVSFTLPAANSEPC